MERVEKLVKGFVRETLIEEEDSQGRVKKVLKENRGEFYVYRRVRLEEKKDGGREIVEERNYLTSQGLDKLAELVGMSKRTLVKKLIDARIMEKDPARGAKREKKKILHLSTYYQLYPIHLSGSEEEGGDIPDDEIPFYS